MCGVVDVRVVRWGGFSQVRLSNGKARGGTTRVAADRDWEGETSMRLRRDGKNSQCRDNGQVRIRNVSKAATNRIKSVAAVKLERRRSGQKCDRGPGRGCGRGGGRMRVNQPVPWDCGISGNNVDWTVWVLWTVVSGWCWRASDWKLELELGQCSEYCWMLNQ